MAQNKFGLKKLAELKSATNEQLAHHRETGKCRNDPLNSLAYIALMFVDMLLDELIKEARDQ